MKQFSLRLVLALCFLGLTGAGITSCVVRTKPGHGHYHKPGKQHKKHKKHKKHRKHKKHKKHRRYHRR
jgi:hypothetical protein